MGEEKSGKGKSLWKKVKYQLVEYHLLSGYLKDNEFIVGHYQSEWLLKQVFLSMFTIHNETLNVWTDTTSLTAENSELKLCLQTMEQQVHLQLSMMLCGKNSKLVMGQAMPNRAQMNYGSQYGGITQQRYYPQNNAMHTLMAAHQLQQLQIDSQQPPQQVLQNQHQNASTHIPNQFAHAHQQPTERIKIGSLASCSRETSADTSRLTTKEWDCK